jgi:hypothetical protein
MKNLRLEYLGIHSIITPPPTDSAQPIGPAPYDYGLDLGV